MSELHLTVHCRYKWVTNSLFIIWGIRSEIILSSLLNNMQAIGLYCSQLQTLNLGWCENVSDVGVMSLANGCPDLRSVDLCGCVLITGISYLWVTKWRFLHCQRLSFVSWENKYTGILVGSGAQISTIFLVFYLGVSVSSQYYMPHGSFWRSSPFLRIFYIFIFEDVPIITGLLSVYHLVLSISSCL